MNPSGRTLGPYEIQGELGRGGMGIVLLARDPRLGRDVAVKILPDDLGADPDRLARFEREAKSMASVNHPNCAAIYETGESDGTRFLVMEHVPGETLRERLGRGPLTIEEAVALCAEVAAGVEAAHEAGVIHRDLKPENVKITPDDRVKVLDFGLARVTLDAASGTASPESPTLSYAATQAGVLLGTSSYMSPEQARGKRVDRRTDIWSFGCVLYECLSGKKAFDGETVAEVLAAVLRTEPDWNALPADCPPALGGLLRRCLRKNPQERMRDIGDVRLELEDRMAPGGEAALTGTPRERAPLWRSARFAWSVTLLALVAGSLLALRALRARNTDDAPILRLAAPLDGNARFAAERLSLNLDISRDGARVLYIATGDGKPHAYLRELGRFDTVDLPIPPDVDQPFFSPDGEWVGFFSEGKLKKLAIAGGSPVSLCDFGTDPRGACWGTDDMIYFAPTAASGISRVPASGGSPVTVASLDSTRGEVSLRWPHPLPGGHALLITIKADTLTSFDDAVIAAVSLETGERKMLIEGGTDGRYLAGGWLAYARAGALYAARFDPRRLELTGPPTRVLEGVVSDYSSGIAAFAVSETGVLAYIAGRPTPPAQGLVRVGMDGSVELLTGEDRYCTDPVLLPGAHRAIISVGAANDKLWICDLDTGRLSPLTTGPGNDYDVAVLPGGNEFVFDSDRAGNLDIYRMKVDGSEPPVCILSGPSDQWPGSISPDGTVLAFSQFDPATGSDIWLLPMQEGGKPEVLLRTPANEFGPAFSPDGRWLAYLSDQSGAEELYVQPYPGHGGRRRLSVDGGHHLAWSHSGRDIFYLRDHSLVAVPLMTAPGVPPSPPRLIAPGPFDSGNDFDVFPDDRGVIVGRQAPIEVDSLHVQVVVGWLGELERSAR